MKGGTTDLYFLETTLLPAGATVAYSNEHCEEWQPSDVVNGSIPLWMRRNDVLDDARIPLCTL